MCRQKTDPATVSFAEDLAGYIDFDEDDYESAYRAGEAAGRRVALQLRVTADDAERFVPDGRHPARVAGWARIDALGGPLEIERGEFTVLARPDGVRRLGYRLALHDGAGRPLTLAGFKLAQDGERPPLRLRVLAGHVGPDDDAPVVATGLLHMPPDGVAAQIATFRVSPPLRLDALSRFGALVVGDAWDARAR
jgi:cholesterol oxidase